MHDSRVILGEINQNISKLSLEAMTTAAVVAYYKQEEEARVSYAGHPPVLYRCGTDKTWSFARPSIPIEKGNGRPVNIPLAVLPDTIYGQLTIPMTPGDRIFIYTDGLIEAPSPRGKPFGLSRLKDVLDANTDATLAGLKYSVLRALHQHTEENLTHDDVTMIVIEIC